MSKASIQFLLIVLFFSAVASSSVHAAGKKQTPQNPGCTPGTVSKTPHPVRSVLLTSVGTKSFQLPNMHEVDLSLDLKSILAAEVTGTQNIPNANGLSVMDPTDTLPCGSRLELRASVSTLELEVSKFGIKFGYSGAGSEIIGNKIEGSAEVTIGTVSMDFLLYECSNGQCSTRAAATVDQSLLQGDIKFMVNFGEISLGPEFLWKTPMGQAIRKMMAEGLRKLALSPQLNKVAWHAKVREFVPETGIVLFDAGSNLNIASNQTFVVYAVEPAVGICDVFKAVAYIRTSKVDPLSSVALVDSFQDARGIHPGDIVVVRPTD